MSRAACIGPFYDAGAKAVEELIWTGKTLLFVGWFPTWRHRCAVGFDIHRAELRLTLKFQSAASEINSGESTSITRRKNETTHLDPTE
jgi:hypothetical protein